MMRLALVVLVLAACSKEGAKAKTEEKGPAAGEIVAPQAPPPEQEDPMDKIAALDSYDEALKMALPSMNDAVDSFSPGAKLFAAWAGTKLRWADVAVTKNETSFKLVRKDSDEARGKRLCASGEIGEIEKINSAPKIFTGGLFSGYGISEVFRFVAVGSTGELVAHSHARFCGVVVGQFDYSNTGGGQTKSVMVVGMFDLPENKPALPTTPQH